MDKKRILVVEDDMITAMDLQAFLITLDYEVPAIVSTGHDAIRTTHEVRPHLILMDIILQGKMTGIEAAEAIRKYHEIPILFMTGHSDIHVMASAATSEPYEYIAKPYDVRILQRSVKKALFPVDC